MNCPPVSLFALADTHCEGRFAVLHEVGYAEAVVPLCGAAIMEALCSANSDIIDPTRNR